MLPHSVSEQRVLAVFFWYHFRPECCHIHFRAAMPNSILDLGILQSSQTAFQTGEQCNNAIQHFKCMYTAVLPYRTSDLSILQLSQRAFQTRVYRNIEIYIFQRCHTAFQTCVYKLWTERQLSKWPHSLCKLQHPVHLILLVHMSNTHTQGRHTLSGFDTLGTTVTFETMPSSPRLGCSVYHQAKS